jgi:hypothetical protein
MTENVQRDRGTLPALDFWTWRRLTREGLGDEAAADLMTGVATRR